MWKDRYTICLFILIPFLSIFGQNDWIWQNPLPQGSSMEGVIMLDSNTIIAAGEVSTVVKSTNGGINWDIHHHINDTIFKIYLALFS